MPFFLFILILLGELACRTSSSASDDAPASSPPSSTSTPAPPPPLTDFPPSPEDQTRPVPAPSASGSAHIPDTAPVPTSPSGHTPAATPAAKAGVGEWYRKVFHDAHGHEVAVYAQEWNVHTMGLPPGKAQQSGVDYTKRVAFYGGAEGLTMQAIEGGGSAIQARYAGNAFLGNFYEVDGGIAYTSQGMHYMFRNSEALFQGMKYEAIWATQLLPGVKAALMLQNGLFSSEVQLALANTTCTYAEMFEAANGEDAYQLTKQRTPSFFSSLGHTPTMLVGTTPTDPFQFPRGSPNQPWDVQRNAKMKSALEAKFTNGKLADRLQATGSAYLEEERPGTVQDAYWSVYRDKTGKIPVSSKGENILGEVLMQIRAEKWGAGSHDHLDTWDHFYPNEVRREVVKSNGTFVHTIVH